MFDFLKSENCILLWTERVCFKYFIWMLHMLLWLYTYISNVCFKCSDAFRLIWQVFHLEVIKVYLDITYVVMAIHACFKCFICFQIYVARATGSVRPVLRPPAHDCLLLPAPSSTSPVAEGEAGAACAYTCACAPSHLALSAGREGLRHRSFPTCRSWLSATLCFKCFRCF
jgi:hypothetical protein